ncbi:MAG: ATP-dependent RecD-like DNA helicase [Syntrophomonadaceae bacterium]|nr:ATP-dependent RecD-like DNA helicase [Syntrophomonadaceae bacterium]
MKRGIRTLETIYGYLDKISYCNEENSFVVAKLKERGKRELSCIVGNLLGVNPGESLQLTGIWKHNPKFGLQFQVERFEAIVPATTRGIEKYLSSGLIRGIGPVMAKRIVETFGAEALDVIENNPAKLTEVSGIGPKRIELISQAWEEQKEIKEIMIFLQGHGVAASHAAKIYQCYGQDSIAVVKDNPYRLAEDIRGIGFLTADNIARAMGVDPNSILRAKEGIVHVLRQTLLEGHVFYPQPGILQKSREALQIDEEIAEQALDELQREQRIIIEDMAVEGAEEGGHDDFKGVYLKPFFIAESQMALQLLHLQEEDSKVRAVDSDKMLEWVEQQLDINLAQRQKEAIAMAVQEKILIITGGPGTGKTTIINALVRIFKGLKLKITMAAPTGRAAKRMQETTGWDALTVHRLLEFNPREGNFKRNRDYPLETDVLIIDELSMMDTMLMYQLLRAIPLHAILILVGDVNQLPSVGPGNVLSDLITSGKFPMVELREIFRQSRRSRIVSNAHRINEGNLPFIDNPEGRELSDFYFIEEENPQKVVAKILDLCQRRIPDRFFFHPVKEIQVLTPMHRGVVGTMNLNVELQKALNPQGFELTRGGRSFRVRDKVMQLVNNYEKDIYNGDIGWISTIDVENQQLEINYDGRRVSYDFAQLDEIQLSYATSIHKAQGSEYPAVIMPILIQHYLLLQRNLVYTGVTRAKRLVILIGSKKALAMAINNNKTNKRFTRLRERLQTEVNKHRGIILNTTEVEV